MQGMSSCCSRREEPIENCVSDLSDVRGLGRSADCIGLGWVGNGSEIFVFSWLGLAGSWV